MAINNIGLEENFITEGTMTLLKFLNFLIAILISAKF